MPTARTNRRNRRRVQPFNGLPPKRCRIVSITRLDVSSFVFQFDQEVYPHKKDGFLADGIEPDLLLQNSPTALQGEWADTVAPGAVFTIDMALPAVIIKQTTILDNGVLTAPV